MFFGKGDDISTLNKVVMYLTENEVTNKIRIVSVRKDYQYLTAPFLADFEALDRAYSDADMEHVVEEG